MYTIQRKLSNYFYTEINLSGPEMNDSGISIKAFQFFSSIPFNCTFIPFHLSSQDWLELMLEYDYLKTPDNILYIPPKTIDYEVLLLAYFSLLRYYIKYKFSLLIGRIIFENSLNILELISDLTVLYPHDTLDHDILLL